MVISDSATGVTAMPTSAYLHIPFCRRRCFYCDFPVSVIGDRKQGDNSNSILNYVEVLLQEIFISAAFCQEKILFGNAEGARVSTARLLETVFFGGGTPSLLSVSQVGRILEALDRHFGIVKNAEISMEIDPGTFSLEQLRGYANVGVNRFSLGVQSFDEELLRVCGRSHTVDDVYRAVDLIHEVGIKNFSIDLISGLPHQSLEQWHKTLEKAVEIGSAHVSSYDLIVEEKTAFFKSYAPGSEPLPTDEMAADMYRMAQKVLTAGGYDHYEISNYAKAGFECRHNQVYWENKPYYGFGMGATSYVFGERFSRPRKTWEYYDWVKGGCEIERREVVEKNDELLESLMLGLRLRRGVNLGRLSIEFGGEVLAKVWSCLQPYYGCGWVQVLDENGVEMEVDFLPVVGWLRLSDPEGFLFSNTILARLFSELG
ncbi:MAG TPA: radical SAM family heme chaperone HemW [Halomicronema sp.]